MSDPSRLRAVAALARSLADDCRQIASRTAALEGVRWESTAAVRYRREVAERVAALRACGTDLDEAADAVHAHAVAVEAAAETLRHEAARLAAGVDGSVGWARGQGS